MRSVAREKSDREKRGEEMESFSLNAEVRVVSPFSFRTSKIMPRADGGESYGSPVTSNLMLFLFILCGYLSVQFVCISFFPWLQAIEICGSQTPWGKPATTASHCVKCLAHISLQKR